jgi:beta-lactamase class A
MKQVAQAPKEYPLLAKRLFVEDPNDTIVNFEPLRSKLRAELKYYGDAGSSLYFEYLPTGTSIRIGDQTQLVGASLLKLPAVMDLYHLAENGKVNLDERVSLEEAWLDDQFGELYKKGTGYTLSIRELAKIALEQSDNTALNGVQAVVKRLELNQANSSYNALDVDFSDTEMTDLELSARSYSSFLKCLYFACYVSPDGSQEILNYLSNSVVGKERLPKYLPPTTTVAHKIGVVGENTQADCGIVYVEYRHYVLCIMLKETKEKGSEVIAQLSKHVYDYVIQAH